MGTLLRLSTVLVLFVAGCATNEDLTGPAASEPPPAVETPDPEELRDEVFGLLDHYASEGVDLTRSAQVEAATVAFLEQRFALDPRQREAGLQALWSFDDLGAGRDGGGYTVSADLTLLQAGFATAVATAQSMAEIEGLFLRQRLLRAGSGATIEVVWLEIMARMIDLLPPLQTEMALARAFDWRRCMLAVIGGGVTGGLYGAQVGGQVGTLAGPGGTLGGAGVGSIIGAIGGAATGAAAGCFD